MTSRSRGVITSEVMTITPEIANEMLKKNTSNRNINRHHLLALSTAMERGDWHLNGQTVSFDTNGDLQDGQHRLAAVIKSGVPTQMLVVRGVDPEARATVDVGRKRTVADELMIRGEGNSKSLASIMVMVKRIDRMPGTGANVILTSVEAIDMLDERPQLRLAAAEAEIIRRQLPIPASVAGYCWDRFETISSETNAAFWEVFENGRFTGKADPRFALERTLNRLAADKTFSTGTFGNKIYLAALITRAWNAFREERPLQVVKHAKGRPFPAAI